MKDLNKREVYDLRGITKEQAKEVYEWLLKNEPQWTDNGVTEFRGRNFIYHNGTRFIFTESAFSTVHISTLFEEKSLEEQLKEAEVKVAELKKQIRERDTPKVGDVCKFWSNDEDEFIIGKLIEVDKSVAELPYEASNGGYYDHAKKLTQQEVIDLLFNNN